MRLNTCYWAFAESGAFSAGAGLGEDGWLYGIAEGLLERSWY